MRTIVVGLVMLALAGCDNTCREELAETQVALEGLKKEVERQRELRKRDREGFVEQDKKRMDLEIELRLAKLKLEELQGGKPEAPGDAEEPEGSDEAAARPAEDPGGAPVQISELRKKGTDAYKKGRYAEAVRFYSQALKENPKDKEVYRLLGSVYARMGKRKKAYDNYRIYVKVCPDCMYTPVVKKILQDYELLRRR